MDNRQKKGLENLKNSGATVRALPEEIRQTWANSLGGFPNDMAQEANKRDMPGTEILKSYIQEVDKSGYDWPVKYNIEQSLTTGK